MHLLYTALQMGAPSQHQNLSGPQSDPHPPPEQVSTIPNEQLMLPIAGEASLDNVGQEQGQVPMTDGDVKVASTLIIRRLPESPRAVQSWD